MACRKKIVTVWVKCPKCRGRGRDDSKMGFNVCSKCGGKGRIGKG